MTPFLSFAMTPFYSAIRARFATIFGSLQPVVGWTSHQVAYPWAATRFLLGVCRRGYISHERTPLSYGQ